MEARAVLEDKYNVIDARMAEFEINTCGNADPDRIKERLIRVHKSNPKSVDAMLKDLLPMLKQKTAQDL